MLDFRETIAITYEAAIQSHTVWFWVKQDELSFHP